MGAGLAYEVSLLDDANGVVVADAESGLHYKVFRDYCRYVFSC